MPQFTYVSRDAQGQRVTAVAEAESRQVLLGRLKERGLTVVEVQERAEAKKQGKAVAPGVRREPAPRPRWSLSSGRSARIPTPSTTPSSTFSVSLPTSS